MKSHKNNIQKYLSKIVNQFFSIILTYLLYPWVHDQVYELLNCAVTIKNIIIIAIITIAQSVFTIIIFIIWDFLCSNICEVAIDWEKEKNKCYFKNGREGPEDIKLNFKVIIRPEKKLLFSLLSYLGFGILIHSEPIGECQFVNESGSNNEFSVINNGSSIFVPTFYKALVRNEFAKEIPVTVKVKYASTQKISIDAHVGCGLRNKKIHMNFLKKRIMEESNQYLSIINVKYEGEKG